MGVIPTECPMHADYKPPTPPAAAPPSDCPMSADNPAPPAAAAPPSDCPMSADSTVNPSTAQVDPANMELPPNQQPSPGQPFSLDTSRETSSIPRAGTDGNWVYPSEQMWWNAALRKGWRWEKDAVEAEDMKHIIRIHNTNNEDAWNEVLHWENFMGTDLQEVKLKKFSGDAKNFSWRARFRAALGHSQPFDRHDWIIERGKGGREVTYIIDYYDVGDENGYKSGEFTELDCRPAPRAFDLIYYRCKAMVLRNAVGLVGSAVNWWNSRLQPPAPMETPAVSDSNIQSENTSS